MITLTEERALEQARRADREIQSGKIRGPLHGIPWGAKDLLDTKGIATTWGPSPGATRFPTKMPPSSSASTRRGPYCWQSSRSARFAYGDIWFGGTTKNPFKTTQGSSGSSAGSASAVAAGLVGFALGTETWGSIASPCGRCGATGFRPSFGLVPRSGAMALCWSLDKVGPIARTVDDCAQVLAAIAGPDADDPATVDRPSAARLGLPPGKRRVGYVKSEFEGRRATAGDAKILTALTKVGVELVPIEVPAGPYADVIHLLICVEAAAAFDDMTRTAQDDLLKWQAPQAWPNLFRATRLLPRSSSCRRAVSAGDSWTPHTNYSRTSTRSWPPRPTAPSTPSRT